MPERQCATCKKQDDWGCKAVRWRTPEQGEDDSPKNWLRPAKMAVVVGKEESYACPRQTINEHPRDWGRLLMFYGLYQKGFLPDRGSVVDQSNVLIEAFRIIDEANAEADKEEAERERRKQNRQNSKGGRRR